MSVTVNIPDILHVCHNWDMVKIMLQNGSFIILHLKTHEDTKIKIQHTQLACEA